MTLLVALLVLTTAVVGLLAVPATPAQATPAQATPALAATTGEFAGRLSFRLSSVDPVALTADGPRSVTLVGRYTNTGDDPIDDISFRFQRGDALTTDAAVRGEVADPSEPLAVVNGAFRPLPGELAPGASSPFAITIAAFGDPADSLAIDRPGVYPVMLNMNGVVHVGDAEQEARVGELHLLVTATSVPAGVGAPGGSGSATPRPVSIL